MTSERERRVLKFLDRGSWKHSWHLPKRGSPPNFDWLHPRAIEMLRENVDAAREHARLLLNGAEEAEQWANECEQRRCEEEADETFDP